MKLRISFYAESSDPHPQILANPTGDFESLTDARETAFEERQQAGGAGALDHHRDRRRRLGGGALGARRRLRDVRREQPPRVTSTSVRLSIVRQPRLGHAQAKVGAILQGLTGLPSGRPRRRRRCGSSTATSSAPRTATSRRARRRWRRSPSASGGKASSLQMEDFRHPFASRCHAHRPVRVTKK